MLTDGGGVLIGWAVDGAKRNAFKLVHETVASIPVERPSAKDSAPQGMFLDKGYDYDEVRDLLKAFGDTAPIGCRREEAQALKRNARRRARRWVVERTH